MITTPLPAADLGRRAMLALTVAAAVDGVGGARRTAGSGVAIATQYPGGRVIGVRLGDTMIEVHVVVEGSELARIVAEIHVVVRAALDRVGERRAVALSVDDIDLDSGQRSR